MSANGPTSRSAPPDLSEPFVPSVIGSTLIESRERPFGVELHLYGELTARTASVLGRQIAGSGRRSGSVLVDLCGLSELQGGALDELVAIQRAGSPEMLIRLCPDQAAVLAGT